MNSLSFSRRHFLQQSFGGLAAALALLGIPVEAAEAPLDALREWRQNGAVWERLREQFLLDPAITHLNTGSLGACPQVVVEAHAAFLRRVEANPVVLHFEEMGRAMDGVRGRAAAFLGADLEEVALTANTTDGMNMIATGLDLKPGDEVLTTTHEHPGGRICWEYLVARRGIVLRQIALPTPTRGEAELLDTLRAGIRRRTRVLSLSHVNTITGLRLPVKAVARLARERDLHLVIDGAQAPGMLAVDLHDLGCDAYACSSHKWMLAPKGCGLLYLRREFQKRVHPVFLHGGFAAYTGATGTRNVPQILAQGVALDFHELIGRDRVEARVLALAASLRQRLQELPQVRLASPIPSHLCSAMTTIQLVKGSALAVQQRLQRDGLVVKHVPGDQLQEALRISTHLYNTEAELDRLVAALRDALA